MTSTRASAVVDGLVGAGLLDPARAGEAETVVRNALADEPMPATPLRRRMAEIAGYVGAAFVVGAAWLFLSETWDELGLGGQVGLLLTSALVLAAGGLVLARPVRRAADPNDDIRGRLASVLLAGAAACAAFGVGLWLGDTLSEPDVVLLLAALTGLVAALAGYVVIPSPIGQLATAVAAFVTVTAGLTALPSDSTSIVPLALSVLGLGGIWLVLAERHVWLELTLGRALGCVIAFIGAQLAIGDAHSWVAYVATAALGVVAFGLYVGTRAWPYLVTGVLAVTVAVPEALYDWAEGSLGAAGILLVTGVTLLLAALAGLRLRQEVAG
ncbi:MAG TPA: hypothetical protein VFH10_04255 [Nocardioides sp.]|uniref:hypothetical protein n=1 Tax=Nocardioides sp. TaxID=35761 RepID=UPI002D7F2873|nr:hypothetical protein [Nocardioides sp.]HET6651832.1 hypothetical protein [Nocardioides sp.]